MSEAPLSILLVDDEAIVRESLGAWFREDGYKVDTASSGRQALQLVAQNTYDIALLDIKMPNMDGLELQARLTGAAPGLTVIIMTAFASVDTAVKALKAGAYDYIVKPFDPDALTHLVKRAREHRSLKTENLRLKERLEKASHASPIIGDSPVMRRVMELIADVAPTDATVLVRGESGTGKELVAHAVHAQSPRRYNPLVEVHCGALAEGVLESELFGHEKGAFTGASYHHKGKFEQADGGTIFLDEIGDISPRVQIDLLQVLEQKTVTRVGGKRAIPVDFRIVAATNKDLEAMVAVGSFREDLFYRLNVVSIEMPPLRERPEDILPLAEHFLDQLCRSMNRKPVRFSEEAVALLRAHDWPGNVRELQNCIERAVVLGHAEVLGPKDLPLYLSVKERLPPAPGPGVKATSLADAERNHIRAVLESCDWNISQTARLLEIDRGTLYNKIHRYGLERPDGGDG